MSKKNIYIVVVVVVFLLIGGWWYLWRWPFNLGQNQSWDINNSEQIFSLKAPDDFDTFKLERLEEKKTLAKDLYDRNKQDTWTWINIGNMYEFARDYDRAIWAYQYVISLNKFEYISRTNLAYIYENIKNDYVIARKYYMEVTELNYTNPDSYFNLANLYEFRMKNIVEAENVYIKGLRNTNNYSDLLVAAIRFYERQNNSVKLAENAKLLLELYPDNEVYKQDFSRYVK